MAGNSREKRWNTGDGMTGISNDVQSAVKSVYDALVRAEEVYQDLLETRTTAGGTDQDLADQAFSSPGVEITASADQVAMITDAKNAMLAIHDLYVAMTGGAFTVGDRVPALRRMNG